MMDGEKLVFESSILQLFMTDTVQGKDKRQRLFDKISAMIAWLLEGNLDKVEIEYELKDIIAKFADLVDWFDLNKDSIRVMTYCVEAYDGFKTSQNIDIMEYMDQYFGRVYVPVFRRRLAQEGIWILKRSTKEKINMLFLQSLSIIDDLCNKLFCCRHNYQDVSLRFLAEEQAKMIKDTTAHLLDFQMSNISYEPVREDDLLYDIASYLIKSEELAGKIAEIGCCIRQCDCQEINDTDTDQILAIMISLQILKKIQRHITRIHLIFMGVTRENKYTMYRNNDLIGELIKEQDLLSSTSSIEPLVQAIL